jgi:DNA-binding transcriptional MerR regulator
MNKVDNPYSSKEVVENLGIGDSTLRKWCLALEEQHYSFMRTSQNKRLFSEKDLFVLSQFKILVQDKNLSMTNAAEVIASKYGGDEVFSNETEVEQSLSPMINEPFLNETLKELKTDVEQLKEMNRMLLKRLDEQQTYIEERMSKRDNLLLQSLRESQETKKILLETKEAQEEKKSRKSIFSFFSKD